jgi:hypothetical protein
MLVALLPATAVAQAPRPVTVDSFTRAETDHYFATYVAQDALGRFLHVREVTPLDQQTVIRMNRDTLYSAAVLDLDAGPVTVEVPDAGRRFVSLLAIDQDHYAPAVLYAPLRRTFTRQEIGTRYMALLMRTFVDPNDPADIAAAHRVQDGMRLEQAGRGSWEAPRWDTASRDAIRGALNTLAIHSGGFSRSFGTRAEVDPIAHLIGTAAGWGGNPAAAATYMSIVPPADGTAQAWRMRLTDVPVDGFWSVTIYDARGFMPQGARGAVSLNNVSSRRAADGSVTLQVGACTDAVPNCLAMPEGWGAVLRLYRPRAAILDGSWRAPALEPMR